MSRDFETIRSVLRIVRRRWMWRTIFDCGTRAAISCGLLVVVAAAVLDAFHARSIVVLVSLVSLVAAALLVAVVRALWPLTRRPSDAQVARFIEERCPQLEDGLVTAVELATGAGAAPGVLAELLYGDVARRTAEVDLDQAIGLRRVARSASLAAASTLVLALATVVLAPRLIDDLSPLGAFMRPAKLTVARKQAAVVRHPASVTGIDVHYQYPPELGLPPRTEEATGDVYAPAGTRVQLRIHTDKPVRAGSLLVFGAAPAPLSREGDRLLSAGLTVSGDGSYRVALTDSDNLQNPGDVEYFIRMLADTPPDVHITQPAADRQVMPLDEVTIGAHAEDERGVTDFDLVYSVGGGAEVAVPFTTKGAEQALDGQRILYLEDLHVHPGDFVTYYARARDRGGRTASAEARSDIFFLEVTPFDQEFMPPQSSQASSGGVGAAGQSLDDVIRAQKEIIVTTWRLDRRARKSRSRGSEADAKTVARAQGDLKERAMSMAGPAPARVAAKPGASGNDTGDAMSNAIDAMGKAVQLLDAVNTSAALPHETRALTELLTTQANNRRWQMQQAARAGAGGNNSASNADLTTLFDQELQRQQRTNYEMPRGSGQQDEQKRSEALERVRQMAQRQDELAQQQQELARNRANMNEDEVKRHLERLTRDQAELRQEAEQLAQQMKTQAGSSNLQGGRGTQGQNSTMREASEAMREAASNLRAGKLDEASARSSEALGKLRSAEQQMRGQQGVRAGAPTLGDLGLEARQLADAQAQIARQAASAGSGKAAADTMRRLAGEKERLAEQVDNLSRGLKRAASSPDLQGRQRQEVGAVSRDLDRLQLPKAMRDGAAAMRAPEKADVNQPPSAEGEQELAKTLGRLADRMAGAAGSGDTQAASEQLRATRDTRDRLADLERRIDELQRQAANGGSDSGSSGRASATDAQSRGNAVGTSGRGKTADPGEALKRLQDEYARELRRAADQLDRMGIKGGGTGITPEGARTLSPFSAPGYHQDYSKWEQLSREINGGLDRAETQLTKKLRDQQAHDRLRSSSSARTPEEYRRLVEKYYESLAKEKR